MNRNINKILLLLITILSLILVLYMRFRNTAMIKRLTEENNIKEEVVSDINYKVAYSYDDVIEYLRRDDYNMIVLGKDDCKYCKKYLPVLENIVKNYNFNFLYVNFSLLDSENIKKILKSDISIPGKCTNSGNDQLLSKGFGTPISLIYKNGEIHDCIRGYYDYNSTLELLILSGMIKD